MKHSNQEDTSLNEASLRESLLSSEANDHSLKSTEDAFSQSPKQSRKKKKIQQQYERQGKKLEGSSWLSSVFFSWIGPFLRFGNNFQITKQNVPTLPDSQNPLNQFERFSQIFERQPESPKKGMRLTRTIAKTYWKQFAIIFAELVIFLAGSMYTPVLTDSIISFVEEDWATRSNGRAAGLFIGVLLLTFVKIVSQSHVFYQFGILGFNLSNTLSLLLYNKALRYPVLWMKKYSVSDIVNYSQVDAQRMTYMGFQLSAVLFTPFQVFVGIWLMYSFIGVSFLSGLGVMVITILLTFFFMKYSSKANDDLLKAKDQRMKVTEEIFSIIRFIKVNSFEKFFFRKLNSKRNIELQYNKIRFIYEILTIFVYWLASPLILSATFATFIWFGNQMSATEAFTTIMLFRILQYPIRLLPTAISELLQIWSSIKRLEEFLSAKQISYEVLQHGEKLSENAIVVKRGNFYWGKETKKQENKQTDSKSGSQANISSSKLQNEQQSASSIIKDNDSGEEKMVHALKDIDLKIKTGTLTLIVGDIGSGKSSLLLALLNEMKFEQGCSIEINGSVTYVPQKAWIMSETLKNNVVFGQSFEKSRFQESVQYSCLKSDIELLLDGQNTEIGQKGTNLSGGQKTRVGLARALYSNRDIYLFDDVLSAVDVHVGEFLMKETILKYLKGKTILMPTHAVKYSEFADHIIVMRKGQIAAQGSYKEVKGSAVFQQIYKQCQEHQGEEKQATEENVEEEHKKIKSVKQQASKNNQAESLEQIVRDLVLPEDQAKGAVSLQVYKEYLELNGGLGFTIKITLCMVAWISLSTLANIWMEKWCETPERGQFYLYMFLSFSISSSIFMLVRAYLLAIGGIKCGGVAHKKIIKALLYAPLNEFYNRVPAGRIINRLTKDMRELDESIGFSVGNFMVSIFSLAGTLVICIYASTFLVILPILLVAYVCNALRKYYMNVQRECVRLENITSSPIVSGFLSTVNGLSTIRSYNLQGFFLKSQIAKVDQNKRLRITREALESWFCQRLTFITFFINMSAIGFCLFSDNSNSSLSGLLLTYALGLGDDIIDSIFSFTYLEAKMVSVERISNFMKIEPEKGYRDYTSVWWTKQEGFNQVITQGRIQLNDFSCRYREGLPDVLKGISLEIKPQQKIGIVGRTGSGKSTLISCLLGIISPSSGSIKIDGKPIEQYFLKDLRFSITMIDQEPTMIKGSFKQNLDPCGSESEERVMEVAKECNLSEVILEKGGINAQISNDTLSVGEKQLLCICRAILKRSKLVLVDEATANIDQKNDELIQSVISEKFKESTVLTIAHRLSTLKNSDSILVLGEGRVLEWGNPEQLLSDPSGVYSQMCSKGNAEREFFK